MAKHKRKKKRARRKNYTPSAHVRDTHHICWQRYKWASGNVRALRDYWYCRINIPKNTLHKKIHAGMSEVPPPRDVNAKFALGQLQYLEQYDAISEFDSIERRLNILIEIFEDIEPETTNALRKQLQIVCEFRFNPLE